MEALKSDSFSVSVCYQKWSVRQPDRNVELLGCTLYGAVHTMPAALTPLDLSATATTLVLVVVQFLVRTRIMRAAQLLLSALASVGVMLPPAARAFAPSRMPYAARRDLHKNTYLTRWAAEDEQSFSSTPSTSALSPDEYEIDAPPPQSPSPTPIRSQVNNDLSSGDLMRAMGTNPRRIFVSLASSTGIALAANFLGVTSNLLGSAPPDIVESTGLDTYYPVNGFKRYNGAGYTLTIPKEWVADTAVELAKATRRAGTLDYGMKRPSSGAPGAGVLPDAAFGPPGKKDARGVTPNVDTNVSVVTSRLGRFSLRSLGPPKEAAETLLRVSLAPEGSGRVGSLLTASEERRGGSDIYQFEYDIDRGDRGVPLRAISVIGVQGGEILVTSTVVAPKVDWADQKYAAKLRRIIESFRLT